MYPVFTVRILILAESMGLSLMLASWTQWLRAAVSSPLGDVNRKGLTKFLPKRILRRLASSMIKVGGYWRVVYFGSGTQDW